MNDALEDALVYLRRVAADRPAVLQVAPTYVWGAGINGVWSRYEARWVIKGLG